MLKILVPVDGSPSSERALKRLIHMLEIGAPAEVHLVHAQPNIDPAKLRSIAQPGLLERLQREEEEQATASARAMLAKADIPYCYYVAPGDPAATIATYAKEHGCDEIVMGTRGMSAIRSLILGSVAMKVVDLVDIPVMLVK